MPAEFSQLAIVLRYMVVSLFDVGVRYRADHHDPTIFSQAVLWLLYNADGLMYCSIKNREDDNG